MKDNMSIVLVILAITIIVLFSLTLIGWAGLFLLNLIGFHFAYHWGLMLLTGLAIRVVGCCFREIKSDKK